jgi:hypothetical protein
MKLVVLSLLLVGLFALAIMMGVREAFDDGSSVSSGASGVQPQKVELVMSPALKSLLGTPQIVQAMNKEPVKVDTLERDRDTMNAAERGYRMQRQKRKEESDCEDSAEPAPHGCPDMSEYIRMDEVPCWNCTLP